MGYKVEFTPTGVENLAELTSTIQGRILRKIRWLAENFDDVTPQALSADLSGLFKLRIGDYRVIYSFDVKTEIITIHRVGHRKDIYRFLD